MRPRHAMKIGVLLFGLVMLGGGCVTPVIPLPPPDTDNMELLSCDTTKKTVRFMGKPLVTANSNYVFVLNETTHSGTILMADTDGGFAEVKDFLAVDGQRLQVWVKAAPHEENTSDTVTVEVDCTKKKGKSNGFVKVF